LDDFEVTLAIEDIILDLSNTSSDEQLKKARLSVRTILQEYSDVTLDKSLTLAETIQKITN
jgi:hypothetical protein